MHFLLFLQLYIIWGIGWGLFCLSVAKEKEKNPQLWFVLGILFSIITFIVLMNIPGEDINQENASVCPFCKHKVGRNIKYCSECGELLKGLKTKNFTTNFCGHCGKEIKKEYKCCPNCGRLLIPLKSFHLKIADNRIKFSNLL